MAESLPQSKSDPEKSLFRAVSMTQQMPRALQGRAPAVAISNLANFSIRAGQSSGSVQGGFEAIYGQTVNDVLGGTGKETFEAVNYLKKVNPSQYKAENGAQYPRTPSVIRGADRAVLRPGGTGNRFADVGAGIPRKKGTRGTLSTCCRIQRAIVPFYDWDSMDMYI